MSGHSKWANIKRKKEGTDAQRAKIFTQMGRMIAVAIREGGPNPESNSKLRDVIAKAKAANVPNDNINRMLAKASSTDTSSYDSVTYEGYGPNGIALIVVGLTDNKNRTSSDIRHYFDKFGRGMGAQGSVAWQFDQKGVLVVEREDRDEDEFMMEALDCGADDFTAEDDVFEILTAPENFSEVREALEAKGITFVTAEVQMVPQTYITLSNEEDIKSMEKLLDALEENDDVQNVWHNWEQGE